MKINGIPQAHGMSLADAAIFYPTRAGDNFSDCRSAFNRFLNARGQKTGNNHGFSYGKGKPLPRK